MESLSQHYLKKRKNVYENLQTSYSQPLINETNKKSEQITADSGIIFESPIISKHAKISPYPASQITNEQINNGLNSVNSINSTKCFCENKNNYQNLYKCKQYVFDESRLLRKIGKLTENTVDKSLSLVFAHMRLLEEQLTSISYKLDCKNTRNNQKNK